MPQMIFVNLPVSDLDRAKAFYEAIGFSINPQFSDDTAACVVVSETIFLMILTHAKFDSFTPLPRADTSASTAALIALNRDSRDAVDDLAAAALAAGGSEPRPATDHGFMYTRTVMDPDGNVFEPFWMDMEAAQTAEKM